MYYDTSTNALYWYNGSAWVSASGGTPPDATTTSKGIIQLAGDLGGTAASPTVNRPKVTAGAFSSGPPGSPADGDIWVALSVDANGTAWQFRYNAGSASTYKWEFIGGAPSNISYTPSTGMAGGWNAYNPQMNPVARAGQYLVGGSATIINQTATVGQVALSCSISGVMGYATTQATFQNLAANGAIGLSYNPAPFTVAAAGSIALAAYIAMNCNISLAQILIIPVRVS
jgi:hypothetical protein